MYTFSAFQEKIMTLYGHPSYTVEKGNSQGNCSLKVLKATKKENSPFHRINLYISYMR